MDVRIENFKTEAEFDQAVDVIKKTLNSPMGYNEQRYIRGNPKSAMVTVIKNGIKLVYNDPPQIPRL